MTAKPLPFFLQCRKKAIEQDDGLADEAPVPDVHPGGQDGHEQPEPRYCLVTKHSQVDYLFAKILQGPNLYLDVVEKPAETLRLASAS